MFTGIIEAAVEVKQIFKQTKGLRVELVKPKQWHIKVGQSITVNGVCSTAVVVTSKFLKFDYMPETLSKTTLASLKVGQLVNLERSLKLADRLDGHLVSGHVDAVGQIAAIISSGNSKVLTIKLAERKLASSSKNITKLIVKKGSITVDGVSLTIVTVGRRFFTVHLIPHTWQHTNLAQKKVGSLVNLEFDILAKYLQRLVTR